MIDINVLHTSDYKKPNDLSIPIFLSYCILFSNAKSIILKNVPLT